MADKIIFASRTRGHRGRWETWRALPFRISHRPQNSSRECIRFIP